MLGIKRKRKNAYRKHGTQIRRQVQRIARLTTIAAVVAVMSLMFIFSYDFLTQHPYFAARDLRVSGARRLSVSQVLDEVGINRQTNIFSVNLTLARKKLLANSWVKEAALSRKLPNTIHIDIVEHRPLAILDLGRRFLIDNDGNIFKEWSPSDPAELPLISGLEFSDLQIAGEPSSPSFQAVMTVLQMGRETENILSNRFIKKIQVDREIGLTLFAFDKNKTIRLGYHNYQDKYKILQTVMSQLNRQFEQTDFESIDLNNPNRIVVHPVKIEMPANPKEEV